MKPNATLTTPQTITVHIVPTDSGAPTGKLADAELHFADEVLAGLKLVGFAIWARQTDAGRYVTFPARAYDVDGARRRFAALLHGATRQGWSKGSDDVVIHETSSVVQRVRTPSGEG